MKTLKIIILGLMMLFAITSCKKEEPKMEVKVAENSPKLDVKVVNEKDPVCGMSTADHLSHIATIDDKIYGFCSEMCKNEFVKNPDKYLK